MATIEHSDRATDDELELRRRARSGEESAVAEMLARVERYIHCKARRFHRRFPDRWSLEDCEQTATVGVLMAIKALCRDDRDEPLMSFAVKGVNWALFAMRCSGDVIRRPRDGSVIRYASSLDGPMSEDSDAALATEVLSREDIFEDLARREASDRVAILLETLPPREREVIELSRTLTQFEIAEYLGVCRQRVSQIKEEALHRLRDEAARLGMKDDAGRRRTTASKHRPAKEGTGLRTLARAR